MGFYFTSDLGNTHKQPIHFLEHQASKRLNFHTSHCMNCCACLVDFSWPKRRLSNLSLEPRNVNFIHTCADVMHARVNLFWRARTERKQSNLDSNISKLPCQNIINDQYLNVWEVRKTFAREKPEKKKKKLFTCHSDLFTNILILMMLS